MKERKKKKERKNLNDVKVLLYYFASNLCVFLVDGHTVVVLDKFSTINRLNIISKI